MFSEKVLSMKKLTFAGSMEGTTLNIHLIGDKADTDFAAAANPAAVKELVNKIRSLDKELEAALAKTSCIMGVGDGSGKLFVYGDHDSIKAVQYLILGLAETKNELEKSRSAHFNAIEQNAALIADRDALKAERDALSHRFNDVSIACSIANKDCAQLYTEKSALAAELSSRAPLQSPFCWVWLHANGSPGAGMFDSEQAATSAWSHLCAGRAIPLYAGQLPAPNPSATQMQWREIGEGDWKPTGDAEWFACCEKSPGHDTRLVEYDAPQSTMVFLPENADQAAGMLMLAHAWLKQHAPERLKTSPAVAVPDGWKLVPIKETMDMRGAGFNCCGVRLPKVVEIYAAMIDAAPSYPESSL